MVTKTLRWNGNYPMISVVKKMKSDKCGRRFNYYKFWLHGMDEAGLPEVSTVSFATSDATILEVTGGIYAAEGLLNLKIFEVDGIIQAEIILVKHEMDEAKADTE
jgi:hypothetical protein